VRDKKLADDFTLSDNHVPMRIGVLTAILIPLRLELEVHKGFLLRFVPGRNGGQQVFTGCGKQAEEFFEIIVAGFAQLRLAMRGWA
jgi:hypothetical protein